MTTNNIFSREAFIDFLKKLGKAKLNEEQEGKVLELISEGKTPDDIILELPMLLGIEDEEDEEIEESHLENNSDKNTLTINLTRLKGLNFSVKEADEVMGENSMSKIQDIAVKIVDHIIDEGNIFDDDTQEAITEEMSEEAKDKAAEKMVANVIKRSKKQYSDAEKAALKAKFKKFVGTSGKKS